MMHGSAGRPLRPGPYVVGEEPPGAPPPVAAATGQRAGPYVVDRQAAASPARAVLRRRLRALLSGADTPEEAGVSLRPLWHAPKLWLATVAALAEAAREREAEAVAAGTAEGMALAGAVSFHLALPLLWAGGGEREIPSEREGARPPAGRRVVLVDGVLGDGRAAARAARSMERTGAVVAGLLFVAERSARSGREALGRFNTFSLLDLDSHT